MNFCHFGFSIPYKGGKKKYLKKFVWENPGKELKILICCKCTFSAILRDFPKSGTRFFFPGVIRQILVYFSVTPTVSGVGKWVGIIALSEIVDL